MVDGQAPNDGDHWDSVYTAIMKPKAIVEWELPERRNIRALRLQGDNNDVYEVSGSLDGSTWFPIWSAGPVDMPGMQLRLQDRANAEARFIRLTARGGDSYYSVGEIEVFDAAQTMLNTTLKRVYSPRPPPPPPPPFNTAFAVVLGAGALGAFLLFKARERQLAERAQAAPTKK
jgi:hypothetical protein